MKHTLHLQMFADGEPSEQAPEAKPEQTPEAKPEPKQEPKYTDADLDRIISKKFAELQTRKEREVNEARKLAEMTAQQKAEYERDQLKAQLDELKRKESLSEMTKAARKILTDDGISVSDEMLAMLVSADADQTKTAVDSFARVFKEEVEKAVKDRLKGEPPRRGTGGGVAPMTKEQIMAIRDPELRQKKMLENKELFGL